MLVALLLVSIARKADPPLPPPTTSWRRRTRRSIQFVEAHKITEVAPAVSAELTAACGTGEGPPPPEGHAALKSASSAVFCSSLLHEAVARRKICQQHQL